MASDEMLAVTAGGGGSPRGWVRCLAYHSRMLPTIDAATTLRSLFVSSAASSAFAFAKSNPEPLCLGRLVFEERRRASSCLSISASAPPSHAPCEIPDVSPRSDMVASLPCIFREPLLSTLASPCSLLYMEERRGFQPGEPGAEHQVLWGTLFCFFTSTEAGQISSSDTAHGPRPPRIVGLQFWLWPGWRCGRDVDSCVRSRSSPLRSRRRRRVLKILIASDPRKGDGGHAGLRQEDVAARAPAPCCKDGCMPLLPMAMEKFRRGREGANGRVL